MHFLRNLIVLIAVGLTIPILNAQEIIPDDPHTTVGRLKNGMTYYLRHNTENKGCADFYIIHNVGALQEEDSQNGLAHFLEHMAFNGTERYPDKTILNFLEKDGVRFGYNVNAYTNRTETVYNISAVPQVRESFVDSVLFVLHDWSCAISCEQDALDAERGVISEEWRRKDEPRALMADLQNKIIYRGAKHADRNVLGTLEIINGFERQEILDFYHKWYRPDLQAIAIVGDIDVEEMEARVKKIFSDIPAQKDPAPKEEYEIPAQDGPVFENMLHPMVKVNTMKIMHKQRYPAREVRNTTGFYKDLALRTIATEILKERLGRACENEGCPVKYASLVTSKLSSDFYLSLFTITPKHEDAQEEMLEFYATEVKRLLDHGFSADELQAAKFQASKRIRNLSNETVKNSEWIKSCIEHFLRGEALISPNEKKEIQAMMTAEATAEEVFEYIHQMFGESEKIYAYTIDQKKQDMLPSTERMKEILAKVASTPLSPVYPEFRKINLDVTYPSYQTRCTERKGRGPHMERQRFGNGVEIVRLNTDPVKASNHMVIKAVFNTGFSSFPQDRIESSRIAAAYIDRNFGFRSYSRKDLRDSPETGNISMLLEIGRDESLITVLCGKEDVDKAIKMLYLTLTDPYFDTDKNLERFKATQIRSIEKDSKSDRSEYNKENRRMRYDGHPWRGEILKEHYESVDMDFVRDIFNRSFGDFSRMRLYVCDDLSDSEVNNIYNMACSLPGRKGPGMKKGENLGSWPRYRGKHRHVRKYRLQAVPKSEVNLSFKYDIKLKNEEYVIFDVLDYIMNARCMNKIREERGGTYSVTFMTEIFPEGKLAESVIAFQTRPEMKDILVEDAYALMADMAENGPTEEEFENARKYLEKHHHETAARFKDSLSKKLEYHMMEERYGIDSHKEYLRILSKVSRKDIRKMARRINEGDSMLSVYTEE